MNAKRIMPTPAQHGQAHDASTPAGPIARAQIEHMLDEAIPELRRLLPEAIAQGGASTLFVTDPRRPVLGLDGASRKTRETMAQLAEHAAGKPLVALLPTETVIGMLSIIADVEPVVAQTIRTIQEPRDPARTPVVANYGEVFGCFVLATEKRAPRLVAGRDVERMPDGREGYLLSLEGALKVYLETDPDALKPSGRERHRRFCERARAAIVADLAIRTEARDVGEVLVDAFGGARLREAFKARGADGLVATIDAVLAGGAS